MRSPPLLVLVLCLAASAVHASCPDFSPIRVSASDLQGDWHVVSGSSPLVAGLLDEGACLQVEWASTSVSFYHGNEAVNTTLTSAGPGRFTFTLEGGSGTWAGTHTLVDTAMAGGLVAGHTCMTRRALGVFPVTRQWWWVAATQPTVPTEELNGVLYRLAKAGVTKALPTVAVGVQDKCVGGSQERGYNACQPPVVLVPGLGASILDVKVDYSIFNNTKCKAVYGEDWTSGFNRLWPAVEALGASECWVELSEARYDPETRSFTSVPGVEVRPRDFGGVDGISNLFGKLEVSSVFETLVNVLQADFGYTARLNLRGAPYDFRLVADKSYRAAFFTRLRDLIEETYTRSAACSAGPSPVVLITHSLGGPVSSLFLNTFVDSAWKDKFIAKMITVGGPWLGAPKALRTLLSGDTQGLPGRPSAFIPVEQFSSGLLLMLPAPHVYGDHKFVSVPDLGEFGVGSHDLETLLTALKRDVVWAALRDVIAPLAPHITRHPGVRKMVCVYGFGIPSEHYFAYPRKPAVKSGTLDQPTRYREDFTYTDAAGARHNVTQADPTLDMARLPPFLAHDAAQGDGTVPVESLQWCQRWREEGHDVAVRPFRDGGHVELLLRHDFIAFVLSHIVGR